MAVWATCLTGIEMVLSVLALLTLLYWAVMGFVSFRGLRRIDRLPSNVKPHRETPYVSIIVAAKEEETSITETIRHLLNQDYERFEIIVINDRSEDRTGVKLEELKKWSLGKKGLEVSLKVIHITSLPQGWLGKNHALYQGYLQARGEYVLFTDADVMYKTSTVKDAVQYMLSQQVDHLTLAPNLAARRFWLRAFVHYFLFAFNLAVMPWRANNDTQHRAGVGIGAFNLISKKAYEAIGTHQAIALRPDDDLQLGMKVKQAGFKQRIALAPDHLQVEWYPSLTAAVRGLEKNLFAGLNYRISLVILAMAGQFLAFSFPFMAIWIFSGWIGWSYLVVVAMLLGTYLNHIRKMTPTAKINRMFAFEALVFPFTALLFIYVFVRSVFLAWKQKGIYWRGTFYSLKELKRTR